MKTPNKDKVNWKKVKDPLKYFHLVAGTCPTKGTREGTTKGLSIICGSSPRDWSHEFKQVWIRGTSRRDQIVVPATTFFD